MWTGIKANIWSVELSVENCKHAPHCPMHEKCKGWLAAATILFRLPVTFCFIFILCSLFLFFIKFFIFVFNQNAFYLWNLINLLTMHTEASSDFRCAALSTPTLLRFIFAIQRTERLKSALSSDTLASKCEKRKFRGKRFSLNLIGLAAAALDQENETRLRIECEML